MAMRRAWAWVSRVILLGTPALYGRVRTAADCAFVAVLDRVAVMGKKKAAWLVDTEGSIPCMHETPRTQHDALRSERPFGNFGLVKTKRLVCGLVRSVINRGKGMQPTSPDGYGRAQLASSGRRSAPSVRE
jgi:hypothetical protein